MGAFFPPVAFLANNSKKISDPQQSWGYKEGPWKGPGTPLQVATDSIHKPPASIEFAPIKHALAATVEPFKFSSG